MLVVINFMNLHLPNLYPKGENMSTVRGAYVKRSYEYLISIQFKPNTPWYTASVEPYLAEAVTRHMENHAWGKTYSFLSKKGVEFDKMTLKEYMDRQVENRKKNQLELKKWYLENYPDGI